MNGLSRLLFALLAAMFFYASPAKAYIQEEPDEKRLRSANDWILHVDVTRLSNYFKNNGSKLFPVINVHVKCIVPGDSRHHQPQTYEDLWYHNGEIIGCHRVNKLPFGNFKLGTIIVNRTDEAASESAAIANALARLTLDLKLKQSTISAISVPNECFNQVCIDLGRYGFYKHESDSYFPFSLHLITSTPSPDKDLYLFHAE